MKTFYEAEELVARRIASGEYRVEYQHWRPSEQIRCTLSLARVGGLKTNFPKPVRRGKMRLYRHRPGAFIPDARGGMTRCWIYVHGKDVVGFGEAVCMPVDTYNKATGRDLALSYAKYDAAKRVYRDNYGVR